MAIKELLIHMNGRDTRATRLQAAIGLAERHRAHVTGLYLIPRPAIPPYVSAQIPDEVFEHQRRELRRLAAEAEAEFRAALDGAGCDGEWRQLEGFAEPLLNRQARFTDLLLMSQPQPDRLLSPDTALEHAVVLGAGRPVLFVPRQGHVGTIGERVLLAWNASREAARAAHDALPLLSRAERVVVLAIEPPEDERERFTVDICAHLARHGVNAEGAQLDAVDEPFAAVLLSQARQRACDLIVAGAYGHSRFSEILLGGVTEDLFAKMDRPVLMAH